MYYTSEEVAAMLRVQNRTVREMAERGELPGAQKIGRQWRFDRDKLSAHLGRELPAQVKIVKP